jgi:hypothetical protein
MKFKVSAHVRRIFGLGLVAGFVALTLSLSPGVASADGGGDHHNRHHEADVTFTKWVTSAAGNMTGVVGGDVGTGTYAGEILSLSDDGTTTSIHALYHFNGKRHSFTADNQVAVADATGIAVITGVVTEGWLKGSQVTGGFKTLIPCDIPTPGNVYPDGRCFQGSLHLERGSED